VAEATGAASVPLLGKSQVVDGENTQAAQRSAGDPLVGELRRRLVPLLVLHFISQEASYGNQLIDRLGNLTEGVLVINPNTMYPLLRDLEARELIAGRWEHPERRSRRFYEITEAGLAELDQLREQAAPALDALARSVARIKAELSIG